MRVPEVFSDIADGIGDGSKQMPTLTRFSEPQHPMANARPTLERGVARSVRLR